VFCRQTRRLLFCLLILLTACTRNSQRITPQLAILRFENLSADPSLDWMGRGFSEILSGELQGSPQHGVIQWPSLHAFDASLGSRPAAPGISTESAAALVAGANGIVYGDFSVVNGNLRATATQEDLATHKMVKVASAIRPASEGIFSVADELARQLGDTRPFSTRNPDALRDYAAALEAPDPAGTLQGFAKATEADPNFGRAYVSWLGAARAQRNRSEADRVVEQAGAHLEHFSELDRAGFDLGAAAIRGDYPAQIEAQRALAQFDPADPNHHRALAETLVSIRDYTNAIVEFRRGLTLRPDDVVALNAMGYAAAYSGDLPTAIRVLRGYEQLRPNEPNPLDSLGDVHFALGHFSEAEKFYLAAHAKLPGFMTGGEVLKAAQARLMTGDIPGANTLFNRYLAERRAAQDPNVAYQAAAWLWATGSRRAAIAGIEDLARAHEAAGMREMASRAHAQAALWWLELGDSARAAEHARQALAEAGPATAAIASLVAYLAPPAALPAPSQSPLKEFAQAYALLFAKQFPPAARALGQIYQRPTGEPDDGQAVLLAWAYVEAGQWQKAEPLLRLTPLPQASGIPVFSSLYFPRLLYLRSVVLQQAGHRAEAAQYYSLFSKLSGPDATIWGEERR
jgi:tetratricopeptide (TPR) repeat protein